MASEKIHNLFCKAGLGIYQKSMTKPLRKFHLDIEWFLFVTFRLYVDLLKFSRQLHLILDLNYPRPVKTNLLKIINNYNMFSVHQEEIVFLIIPKADNFLFDLLVFRQENFLIFVCFVHTCTKGIITPLECFIFYSFIFSFSHSNCVNRIVEGVFQGG